MDARRCPWCGRWALKDTNCNYVFACGMDERGGFRVGAGCGRPFCFRCGLRFCGRRHDMWTGARVAGSRDHHDEDCCRREPGFAPADYCPGGHNSHCGPRFRGAPGARR